MNTEYLLKQWVDKEREKARQELMKELEMQLYLKLKDILERQ